MATSKVFDKSVCKCERCGHVWIPKSEVYTCAKCRSPYWNKPKMIGLKPDTIMFDDLKDDKKVILDEPAQEKAALQCAIIQNFDCLHYKISIPVTALCDTCFECDFWDTDKVKILREAFNDIQEDEIIPEAEEPVEEPLPKNPEEILKKLEASEINNKENKISSINDMKEKCYKCKEKYKDNDNDWQCNFFTFKSAPKFDYCRLCWELPEIWDDRAAGYKKQ